MLHIRNALILYVSSVRFTGRVITQ